MSDNISGSATSRATPPLRPMALINFKKTDDALAKIVGSFWQLIWSKKNPAIDQKTKYLLSLSNAVGARRFRQATRELVKAYAAGTTIPELDELFSLFVWNQGAGEFASEIGPSPLFGAYQSIKKMETEGSNREAIINMLKVQFGEENPEVGTAFQKPLQ
ncbi:MAG: hypothetical protein JW863_13130 [Chitinispirillaceae bacterium]|nr:hypothetical protein [Chitinispirillaceae bacterium]